MTVMLLEAENCESPEYSSFPLPVPAVILNKEAGGSPEGGGWILRGKNSTMIKDC